ncbi:MAG: hypothetical protein A2900_04300 [Candidatus Chisholmbacteria bacterium RIFCSPLOWO2_01_FULL_50_28]|uniref:Mannosyl-glycoprotein endo-beta-N-acetylglucosamidase-like domain-containing protein n=1 Tax=Candidatus Chisholmbacteria bacterium RIFCSPHIGHO2_01_FULL_52_32 TaxID=1797591 RepID=A0A1G1VSI1_9BACT|nr:MAG: hypothetical protein A2786_02445 [Candidatus Chisholmbacteria bacterium RIFCSPHIGHO2_01_FULL_52_32]OGY20277.1 MAG: hypothetical protein A2900_04300 [Candidatus Chisholmbacteria bacterium RIFCSPLOWO2_01_FULL_50_28]
MKKLVLFISWFPITLLTIFTSLRMYEQLVRTKDLESLVKVQARQVLSSQTPFLAYAAIPQASTTIKTAVQIEDARPVMIDQYLTRYDSPLAGYGQFIVQAAERYDVDPYLFIAIAQQESNLGKKMPSSDCYNAWGYGIHSRGTLCFTSWEEGIETVLKGLSNKYLERGLTDPEDIMRTYTPFSNGSWASGVDQFIEELTTGNF